MQKAFDFGAAAAIGRIRRRLQGHFGRYAMMERLEPMDQLVQSIVGSRTLDEVSWRAFTLLRQRYPSWSDLAHADEADIEAGIAEVTFADAKARHLRLCLRRILARGGGVVLDSLGQGPVGQALAWLESLPGVGPKIAAAVLNFSTLDQPVFVVDTHVLRVLRRLGLIGLQADTWRARAAVMEATEDWSARELAELHALIKRLGQTICRARKANCPACPLRHDCRAAGRPTAGVL